MDFETAKKRKKLYPKQKDIAVSAFFWGLAGAGLFIIAMKVLPIVWHVMTDVVVTMIWHTTESDM